MPLPDHFRFSQSSLQDYVDCPRRFQLRHMLMQPWPALITQDSADFEQYAQRARDFHRLAKQHTLGIDVDRLAETIHDLALERWWKTYLNHPPPDLPQAVFRAEVVVGAPLGGYRIVAAFDLLAVDPGKRLVVVDWKTTRKRPPRVRLAQRLQTRVYRYLAVEATADYNDGQRPSPEQVEMVYWFANDGGGTERFPYDAEQHAADERYLENLIQEVSAQDGSIWPLTSDLHQCRFCNYRSLCERDVEPAFLDEFEDDLDLDTPEAWAIDLEQIAEVVF